MAPATKRGAFPTPAGRLACFPTGESPVVKVLYKLAPSINLEAPYLPSGTVLHTSRGREPSTRPGGVSRSRTEPLVPRAVRSGGAINPRGEAASTFGNTGKRRAGPDPDHATGLSLNHLQKNADIPLIGPFCAHPALPAAKIYPMILVPFTDFLGIKNAICDDHLMGIALAR